MSFEIKYVRVHYSEPVELDDLDEYLTGGIEVPIIFQGGFGVGKTTISNCLPEAIEHH
jgi:putative ribosome biogenesis GTPase RsgA